VRRLVPIICLALALMLGATAGAAPSITGKRAQVRRLQAELARLDQAAGAAAVAHNRALDRLDSARAELAQTARDLAETRRSLKVTRRLLTERIVALYRQDQPTAAEIVLSGQDLTEAQATLDALAQISRFDARLVSTMRERRAKLDVLKQRRARSRVQAEDASRRSAERRRQVQALVARQQRVVSTARADLKALIRQENERLARLAAQKSESTRTAVYRGGGGSVELPPGVSHVFPIRGPSHFSDDWLFSRPGGRYHEGIDLFAAYGTPIVAVANGTLFRVGYNGLGGWRLWLRDTAGTTFYYAHLSSFAPVAREGASVSGGTVIGYVGDSGDARGTSPHVHFEIHPGGGGPTRPYPHVSAWPRV
jgi:murein DD-endopeptidase MepM/ murein hydrolase activator NlpD